MKLSHSKLQTILSCPMTYYLTYVEGISKKEEKAALAIGSAVHWGIEHNTEDLSEYYKQQGTFKQSDNYTRDQMLAESMVHGYLKHKDEIFETLLKDKETGEKLELLTEQHEIYLTAKLPSYKYTLYHDFVGIIDLLLLTNKGFILIDYKTSSQVPDWNNYLEQIYRYIMLLRTSFPDIPVYKIGIINLRKTGIRQKKNETEFEFNQRLRFEYELNDENYINYHEYLPEEMDKRLVDEYINNLSHMCDAAEMINDNKMWYINYGAANGVYGKSEFWDIFYKTPDAFVLYKISDKIWDEDTQTILKSRDCVPIDMSVIDKSNVLNHYDTFAKELREYKAKQIKLTGAPGFIMKDFLDYLKGKYICDESLLEMYLETCKHQ